MTDKERFTDNRDGTITDHELKVMWKKTDSFQDTKKWLNWLKIPDYAKKVNEERFAGYDNWRCPSKDEAWALFNTSYNNKDKYGEDIYLHPFFEPGSAGTTWTSESKDSAALIIQYDDGGQVWPSQYSHMNMAARLVRDIV